MKKWFTCFVAAILLFATGCQSNTLAKPETDLEFWIAENVDDFDFSNYQTKGGMMGGTEYYGTGYIPTIDEDGRRIDPKYCVLYTVTAYPDYSSKEQHVTSIFITDPAVALYGFTLDSSLEEIRRIMCDEGFVMEETASECITAKKGKFTFHISKESIIIRVSVTNRFNICF